MNRYTINDKINLVIKSTKNAVIFTSYYTLL